MIVMTAVALSGFEQGTLIKSGTSLSVYQNIEHYDYLYCLSNENKPSRQKL